MGAANGAPLAKFCRTLASSNIWPRLESFDRAAGIGTVAFVYSAVSAAILGGVESGRRRIRNFDHIGGPMVLLSHGLIGRSSIGSTS